MQKRIFSGIQPSGVLHLGNYLGAIKNWVALQEDFESIFCVVDLHAITVPQNPEELRQKTLEVAKTYLAAGINPEKSTIFVQSHVPEHTELAWILNTITKTGELSRMTQFKDKADISSTNELFTDALRAIKEYDRIRTKTEKEFFSASKLTSLDFKDYFLNLVKATDHLQKSAHKISSAFIEKNKIDNVSSGILNYPVLMAADILLYDTELVPVGEDQIQHVELARELARRFNTTFGRTFSIPEPHVAREGMRIMGLDDPTKKMSKSAPSEYNYISLSDPPEKIREKIMRAVTDSANRIKYSDDQPALKNLLNIYALLDNAKPGEIAESYQGKGYAEFKEDLANVVVDFFAGFKEKYDSVNDKDVLDILRSGAEKVRPLAKKKMEEVRKKIGLLD